MGFSEKLMGLRFMQRALKKRKKDEQRRTPSQQDEADGDGNDDDDAHGGDAARTGKASGRATAKTGDGAPGRPTQNSSSASREGRWSLGNPGPGRGVTSVVLLDRDPIPRARAGRFAFGRPTPRDESMSGEEDEREDEEAVPTKAVKRLRVEEREDGQAAEWRFPLAAPPHYGEQQGQDAEVEDGDDEGEGIALGGNSVRETGVNKDWRRKLTKARDQKHVT